MGGGLLQLVAYGAQDMYLTGNPQITFFKAVYRRHTNFAIEAIQQTFNGTPGYGQRVTCTIARNGDLIHRVYLALDLSGSTTNDLCKFYGLRLINYVEVEIGGQKIDKHYSHWMYIWNELSLPKSKKSGYYDMIGAYGGKPGTDIQKMLYVPLEFWFCRNVGLALPLISLQYHEVKINLAFENKERCQGNTSALDGSFSASLWVDYIFLDTDERRRFAQLSHEYLIEQLQFTGQESVQSVDNVKPKLNFNHPCKELVWFVTKTHSNSTADTNNNWMNYSCSGVSSNGTDNIVALADKTEAALVAKMGATAKNGTKNPIATAKLVLNGNDRFAQRNGSYFNLIQPFQHHENIPSNAGINVYSFALKPEEHQPSGTLNMSRIDTAVLNLSMNSYTGVGSTSGHNLSVYAINYNVLRIMSGMGGIAYSN
jgi:hypothetical protein